MTTRPSRTNKLDLGDLIVLYKGNDSDYRTISVPDFMDKVKDEISDGVLTWSGRTQEDKNKDMITPLDFKAKGDGVTNDTQAFIDLELEYSGLIVDLLGKTYLVDQDFNKNKYTNGFLKIGNSTNVITKKSFAHADIKYRANIGNGFKIGELLSDINVDEGSGTSIIQGVDYHPQTGYYYATRRHSGFDANEKMVLVKYKAGTGGITEPLQTSEPSNVIGHQSLSHTLGFGFTCFWTIGGSDIYAEKSRHVTRFEVDPSLNPINVKHFKVFGDEFVASSTRCMSISPSYDILVVVNATIADATWYCRVFKVSDLVDDSIDYSDKYIHQFTLSKYDGRDLQDCTTDGKFIYFLNGASSDKGLVRSVIEIHTLDGALVCVDKECAIGRSEATSMPYTYYEPEAIFWLPSGNMGFSIAIGKKGGRGTPTPHTNIIMSVVVNDTLNLKMWNSNPAIHFEGANAFGILPAATLRTVEVDGFDVKRVRQELTSKFQNFYPVESAGACGYNVEVSTALDMRYRLSNITRTGMVQVSASGNFGLYDTTNDKWLIYSSLGGLYAYVLASLEVAGSLYADIDNTKTLGASNRYWKETFTKKVTYSAGVFDSAGAGSPEGVLVAGKGSTYRRTDGSTGSTFYVKESGTGNTGWIAK